MTFAKPCAGLLVLALAGAAHATSVPLQPIGLPFAPERPTAVTADHPLYHALSVDPVVGMPNKVGKFLLPITSAREMNEALRQTLERANMLAPAGTTPKVRLEVHWLGLDAPAKISTTSKATSTMRYVLFRTANGEQLFERQISTFSQSKGGDGADRLKGNARLAIMTNLGSAVLCLDKAAYQRAPADCALTPKAVYRARQPATVTFVPR